MGRSSKCCEKLGLKKGPWTSEEDKKLLHYIQLHGYGSWRTLPQNAGLKRCGKSCRLRWINYLRPDVKRGKFSSHEERTIIQLHALLGNRWSTIATYLPNRTDNEIKNYWNTYIKKRLIKMGIDPVTHKSQKNAQCCNAEIKNAAMLSHMAQWETTRLEAEARLRKSKLFSYSHPFHSQLDYSTLAPPPPPPAVAATSGSIFASSQNTIVSSPPYSILKFPLRATSGLASNSTVDACQDQERLLKGRMEDFYYSSMYNVDSLGFVDPHGDDTFDDYEESKNYWKSVLNLVNSWSFEICEQIS